MSTMKRKDLKPRRPVSDQAFLAGAKASATKAATKLERDRRSAEAAAAARAQERRARA